MKQGVRASMRNALVQRVKRHTCLSTLFRAPLPTWTPTRSALSNQDKVIQPVRSLEGIVQASLMPMPPALHPRFTKNAVTPGQSTGFTQENGAPSIEPVLDFVKASSIPQPDQPPESKPNLPDEDWKRLQTIFRKHQEKSSRVSTDSTAPSDSTSRAEVPDIGMPGAGNDIAMNETEILPGAVTPAKTNQVSKDDGNQTRPVERVNVQSAWEETSSGEQMSPESSSPPSRTQNQAKLQDVGISSCKDTHTLQPSSAPQPGSDRPGKHVDEQPDHLQTKRMDVQVNELSTQPSQAPLMNGDRNDNGVIKPGEQAGIESIIGHSEKELPAERNLAIQNAPLQTAWPVQQSTTSPEWSEIPESDSSDDTPGAVYPLVSGEKNPSNEVKIYSAPTANDMEIIPLIRPRPRPGLDIPTPVKPIIQRKMDNRRENTAEADHSELIQTSIGPLPSDLWRLVQQTPPRRQSLLPKDTADSLSENRSECVGGEVLNNQTPAPSAPDRPGLAAHLIDRTDSDFIQRDPVPEPDQGQVGSPSKATLPFIPPGSSSPQVSGDNQKLHELARRVYAEIRRQLAVDWERRRG